MENKEKLDILEKSNAEINKKLEELQKKKRENQQKINEIRNKNYIDNCNIIIDYLINNFALFTRKDLEGKLLKEDLEKTLATKLKLQNDSSSIKTDSEVKTEKQETSDLTSWTRNSENN